MKKYLFLLIAFLACISCADEKDLYQPPAEKDKLDFSLTDKINVTSDLPDNTRCLVFTSDPTGEGNTPEPIMVAYAPFNLDVPVAKAVDKLYTYVNGEVKVHQRGNIKLTSPSITRSGAVTRADDDEQPGSHTQIAIDAPFLTAINNYYPEKLVNVYGQDLETSSDLVAYVGVKEIIEHPDGSKREILWGDTKVWITYVTNGGSGFSGSLWYYTYKVNDAGVPTTSLADIERNKVKIFDKADPSKKYPADGPGKRVYLGQFEPGTRIGFKFLGNATYDSKDYPKYSTPYYNAQAYPRRYTNKGSWTNTYNGMKITGDCKDYRDNAYTSGVIRIWDYKGNQYATLGMENRLPSESLWDGDFNDMICLIEATPLSVENTIDPPTPDPNIIKFGGYWLFEDNYPAEGDYDFNDLVVKYAVTEIENKPTIIDLQFMAKGADNANSFGINGTTYFENLDGYENVYAHQDKVEQVVKQITLPKADEYIPMLNNGKVTFDLKTYWDNEEPFPCVLNIPIVDNSTFLWCQEGKRIDVAYPRYKEWVNNKCSANIDWYLDTPVSSLVWDK